MERVTVNGIECHANAKAKCACLVVLKMTKSSDADHFIYVVHLTLSPQYDSVVAISRV